MADRSCLGMSKNRTVSLYLDNFPAFSGEIWEKKKEAKFPEKSPGAQCPPGPHFCPIHLSSLLRHLLCA